VCVKAVAVPSDSGADQPDSLDDRSFQSGYLICSLSLATDTA